MAKFNKRVNYESYADWIYSELPYEGYFRGVYNAHENKPEALSLLEVKDILNLEGIEL